MTRVEELKSWLKERIKTTCTGCVEEDFCSETDKHDCKVATEVAIELYSEVERFFEEKRGHQDGLDRYSCDALPKL